LAENGSKGTFKLFSQWPEPRRQRMFPPSVEHVLMTQGGHSPTFAKSEKRKPKPDRANSSSNPIDRSMD
jgi:hypothetical protein